MFVMINLNKSYSNAKQTVLPILISDYLDICDPVLTFDRFMEGMDLEKYLKGIPKHCTGRLRYNPVSMLKTVLFGFMAKKYFWFLLDRISINITTKRGRLQQPHKPFPSSDLWGKGSYTHF